MFGSIYMALFMFRQPTGGTQRPYRPRHQLNTSVKLGTVDKLFNMHAAVRTVCTYAARIITQYSVTLQLEVVFIDIAHKGHENNQNNIWRRDFIPHVY